MFFDKILNFFKIENLYKESDFRDSHFQSNNIKCNNTAHQTENYIGPASTHEHVMEILSYWSQHQYQKVNYNYYREASSSEKQEYALIDILSCFSKGARNLHSFSQNRLHDLGIINFDSYTQFLISEKYIMRADIINTLIAKYNSQELKTIAESVGVKKTGNKSELAQRIANELSSSEVNRILSENPLYILSEKGHSYLAANEDYVPLHKYLYLISLAEFNDNRIPNGGRYHRNFYDTMFQILTNRKFFFERHRDFEDVGSISLQLYNMLIEESKKTTNNVPADVISTNYVENLYIQTCFCFHAYSSLEHGVFPSSYNSYIVPKPNKDTEKLASQEPYINYELLFINKPPSFFTYSEFKQYIHEMLSGQMFDGQKWDLKIQNRVREFDNMIKGEY